VGKASSCLYRWVLLLGIGPFGGGCGDGATFQQQSLSFVAQTAIPTGAHPNALVLADLDRDGDLDVIVPGLVSADLWIHENLGGAVQPGRALPLAAGAIAAAAADFDEDGAVDLALSMPGASRVDVLAAGQALVLRPLVELALEVPADVRAGDLDGDGHVDLVVSRYQPGAIWTLRGDGRGGFGPPRLHDAPGGAVALGLGDVDGDGRLDVAAACATADTIAILSGDGAGGLAPARELAVGRWPSFVLPVDLDGAAPVELVATTNLGDTLAVARRAAVVESPAGAGPIAAAAADLDGDGLPEIAVTHKWENTVGLYRAAAGGGLTPVATLPAGDGPTPLALGDIDGDGRLDLVVANGFSNDVVVYLRR
jgi:hypothetical protein